MKIIKSKALSIFAENIFLFLIIFGLLETAFFRAGVSGPLNLWGYLFLVLFGLIYIRYYSLYWKQNRLKKFFRFHLVGILLGIPAGIASIILTQLLVLFLMSGKDYGLPMVAGLIFGVFFLLFFPLVFMGLYTLGLILLRHRFMRGVSITEGWRLSSLGLGVVLTILCFLPPRSPSPVPPPILSGPPLTLQVLSSPEGSILYGVLPKEQLKGFKPHRVLLLPNLNSTSPTLEELSRAESYVLESTPLSKGLFLETLFPIKHLGTPPYLVVYTLEKGSFGRKTDGPILFFPVRTFQVSTFFGFQEAFWKAGPRPALHLVLKSFIPIEPTEACFNFLGDLNLKAPGGVGYREIYFQGGPTYYRRLKGEEFLCYFLTPLGSEGASDVGYLAESPGLRTSSNPYILGPFILKFPVEKEDFHALAREGFYRTGRNPLPAKFFLVARPVLFHLRESPKLYSPIFELEIPRPKDGDLTD